MKFQFFTEPTSYLYLEDIFSDEELNLMWSEIEVLTPSLDPPGITGSAFYEDDDKTLKKNNMGLFLHETYARPQVSPIISHTEKVLFDKLANKFEQNNWFYKTYRMCNWNTILLSYYEDGQYYEPHRDVAVFTALFWLWKEPKKFKGGNLMFTEHGHIIECKNNCGILFPSAEEHQVFPVNLEEEYRNQNLGRYVISTFCGVGRH